MYEKNALNAEITIHQTISFPYDNGKQNGIIHLQSDMLKSDRYSWEP